MNCIKNSIESTQQSPIKKITLRTRGKILNRSGWVEVQIEDSGCGIGKEDLKYIGTPFFTTKLRGTGLGLTVCQRIIAERHKGSIVLESEPGKGTTVVLRLSVTPARTEDGEESS